MSFENAKTNIEEMLNNVSSIKGDNFANCIRHSTNLLHLHRIINMMSNELGADHVPPAAQHMFVSIVGDLMLAYGFDENDIEEMMGWNERIIKQILAAEEDQ
jgi:hypothetical protein